MKINSINFNEIKAFLNLNSKYPETYTFVNLYKSIIDSARRYICLLANSGSEDISSFKNFVEVKSLIWQLKNQYDSIVRNYDPIVSNYFYPCEEERKVSPYSFAIQHLEMIGEISSLPNALRVVSPLKMIVYGNEDKFSIINSCASIYFDKIESNNVFGISSVFLTDQLGNNTFIRKNAFKLPIIRLNEYSSFKENLSIDDWFIEYIGYLKFDRFDLNISLEAYYPTNTKVSHFGRWQSIDIASLKRYKYILLRHHYIDGYSFWIFNAIDNSVAIVSKDCINKVMYALDSMYNSPTSLFIKKVGDILDLKVPSPLPEKESKLLWLFGYPFPNIKKSKYINRWLISEEDFKIIQPIVQKTKIKIITQ